MPKVSVIVPVYNVEAYIERCLQSIREQTLNDIEIIVVDDCTPDNSMTIVEHCAKEDNRIKIIKHEYNKGIMCTRQTGYMAATGEYITFCDSDDYLPINAIELLYNEAIKTEADIVSGNYLHILVNGKTEKWTNELKYGNDKKSALKSLLLGELTHCLWSKLFKRELLQDYQYQIFEHFTNCEDGCLFYQLIDNTKKIIQINDCVYNYLQNKESSTHVRLNDIALRSICIANRFRHEATIHYADLDSFRHLYITNALYMLYSRGYGYGTNFNRFVQEQGLEEYLSLAKSGLSKKKMIKLWLKRYLQGLLWYVKSKF